MCWRETAQPNVPACRDNYLAGAGANMCGCMQAITTPDFDYGSSCYLFSQCLQEILAFSTANPTHFPIVVFIHHGGTTSASSFLGAQYAPALAQLQVLSCPLLSASLQVQYACQYHPPCCPPEASLVRFEQSNGPASMCTTMMYTTVHVKFFTGSTSGRLCHCAGQSDGPANELHHWCQRRHP